MTNLKGSEKQVSWANSIRKEMAEVRLESLKSKKNVFYDISYRVIAKYLNIEIPDINLLADRAKSRAIMQGQKNVEEQSTAREEEFKANVEKKLNKYFAETEDASKIIDAYLKAEKDFDNFLLII